MPFVSGTPLRGVMVNRIGERAVVDLFSLLSLVGILWLSWAYARVDYPVNELIEVFTKAMSHGPKCINRMRRFTFAGSTHQLRRFQQHAGCLMVLITVMSPVAVGQSWENRLQTGNRIIVDSQTNQATMIDRQGGSTPLWDGVHRLQDGSTITIRKGVVVPNEGILEARRKPLSQSSPLTPQSPSACILLQRKTCGLYNECSNQEPCSLATQLVQFEREALQESRTGLGSRLTNTPEQCRKALRDREFFTPCSRRQKGTVSTPCDKLVMKVCGNRNQCADQPGCSPAKQLIEMEYRERISSIDPKAATFTTGQCQQALRDEAFFAACKQ